MHIGTLTVQFKPITTPSPLLLNECIITYRHQLSVSQCPHPLIPARCPLARKCADVTSPPVWSPRLSLGSDSLLQRDTSTDWDAVVWKSPDWHPWLLSACRDLTSNEVAHSSRGYKEGILHPKQLRCLSLQLWRKYDMNKGMGDKELAPF